MKELSLNELSLVSGGAAAATPSSTGFMDSIEGALVDAVVGAVTGGVIGGTNGGAAGAGGVLGFGLIGQAAGAIGGLIAGGVAGTVLGLTYGYSGSGGILNQMITALTNGSLFPKAPGISVG